MYVEPVMAKFHLALVPGDHHINSSLPVKSPVRSDPAGFYNVLK